MSVVEEGVTQVVGEATLKAYFCALFLHRISLFLHPLIGIFPVLSLLLGSIYGLKVVLLNTSE